MVLKVEFFVTCNWVGDKSRMSWQDIETLHNQGHDIESKTMTHRDLNHLSLDESDFEAGQSKQCLADHGINATIFATPHGDASDNTTVINVISKYYDFADNGFSDLLFLQCDSISNKGNNNKAKAGEFQTGQLDQQRNGCSTYSNDGSLSSTNRYSIREWSHNSADASYMHNDTKIFDKFVKIVNSQAKFNKNGMIKAIPIVAYHTIDDSGTPNIRVSICLQKK